MKKKKHFLRSIYILLMCALFSCVTLSCDSIGCNCDVACTGESDSAYVASIVKSVMQPRFSTVQEVEAFQVAEGNRHQDLELFITIPPNLLDNVTSVCLSKSPQVTMDDIVREYKVHRSVYDNLPLPDTPSPQPENVETVQQPEPTNVSYRYETDTVTGKQILIKEERYESN